MTWTAPHVAASWLDGLLPALGGVFIAGLMFVVVVTQWRKVS